MPIYVQIKGVEGTVQEKNHKKWLAVDSCDFEVVREVTEGTGAAKNREFKAPVVSVINFATKVDDSTGLLAKWSMGEPSKGTVLIDMVRTAEDGFLPYIQYRLAACILSKFDFSADDSPEEKGSVNFSLSFLSIEIKFTQYNEDQTSVAGPTTQYDLRTGTKSFVEAV
jgi:type VI secretion system secreted protein Hcp